MSYEIQGVAMKKTLSFILILSFCTAALAIDISEDGRQTAESDNAPGHIVIITDEVPFADSPDYQCDLRMQVGGMAFGDFDGDNDPDLAVGCYHSQSYPPYDDWRNFVLLNNSGELETTPSWWSSDERSTTDVKWADFNGDQYPDLFACNGDFSFDPSVIYFGSADGLSETPGWFADDNTWTLYAAPLDIDHDGDIDVATANQGASPDPYRHIYIYHNMGDGLPTVPTWASADQMITNFLDWGDMDGDGWEDLAASKWANFETGIYRNNNGTITGSPVWTTGNTRSDKGIGWADIDGDTYPELAIGGTNPTVLYDNIDGAMGNSPIWESNNSYHGCQDLVWGDIDGDGDPDLATTHFSTGAVRIYLNVDGVFDSTPSWVYDGNGSGTALALADINGDGNLDLAVGQSGNPSVMIFLNTMQTSINDRPPTPGEFALAQNYPNPFNASTKIDFEMSDAGHANLAVYDLMGRLIVTLIDGEVSAGIHSVVWKADDVSSGIYFYKLTSSDRDETRRMVLLK